MKQQRAVVSVIGTDKVGIIANVTKILADHKVNVLDISQTIMQEFFTMMMVVDLKNITVPVDEVREMLEKVGNEMGLTIRLQQEEIFHAMHRI
ncbi:ACT domain-containing protein [Massilibacterium senegalense]|uniref:ACT domain-containing protein n=1 Tax=Massilibacterium senegalense TaxID=1632858 RepID=UPI000784689D|nr:ACT domain-containing protein [Massilibacterium senegalense]